MDDNKAARDQAQNLRYKARRKFRDSEKDMEAAIDSMGAAISTLAAIGADQTDDKTRDRADNEYTMGQGAGFMQR